MLIAGEQSPAGNALEAKLNRGLAGLYNKVHGLVTDVSGTAPTELPARATTHLLTAGQHV